jgi:hypothetical protein
MDLHETVRGWSPFFWDMALLDACPSFRPFTIKPLNCLGRSGTHHAVKRCDIPEERRPHWLSCEGLHSRTVWEKSLPSEIFLPLYRNLNLPWRLHAVISSQLQSCKCEFMCRFSEAVPTPVMWDCLGNTGHEIQINMSDGITAHQSISVTSHSAPGRVAVILQ